ncbi:hypothetical protein QE428_001267 [Microbacterium sp. SORGH_AS 505]|nr:hypothetical protein [Microbacterium sp. SORGH_AS_0505]
MVRTQYRLRVLERRPHADQANDAGRGWRIGLAQNSAGADTDIQFFADFALECHRGGLACFNLAAGELPQATSSDTGSPAGAKNSTAVMNDCGYDNGGFWPHWSTR